MNGNEKINTVNLMEDNINTLPVDTDLREKTKRGFGTLRAKPKSKTALGQEAAYDQCFSGDNFTSQYDDESPVNYSLKYSETESCKTIKSEGSKKKYKDYSDYAEDQPTNFSLKYAEKTCDEETKSTGFNYYESDKSQFKEYSDYLETDLDQLTDFTLKYRESVEEEIKNPEFNYYDNDNDKAKVSSSLSIQSEEGTNARVCEQYNCEDETPLMFSRCSSLNSLSSFVHITQSIPDDRSSVVSDFSRMPSGIISPSELPDSPTQTAPSSPKRQKAVSLLAKSDYVAKKSVFEDDVATYRQEDTPIEFSRTTSLSSLNIDSPVKSELMLKTASGASSLDCAKEDHCSSAKQYRPELFKEKILPEKIRHDKEEYETTSGIEASRQSFFVLDPQRFICWWENLPICPLQQYLDGDHFQIKYDNTNDDDDDDKKKWLLRSETCEGLQPQLFTPLHNVSPQSPNSIAFGESEEVVSEEPESAFISPKSPNENTLYWNSKGSPNAEYESNRATDSVKNYQEGIEITAYEDAVNFDFDSHEPLTAFEEALIEQCIRWGMPRKNPRTEGPHFTVINGEQSERGDSSIKSVLDRVKNLGNKKLHLGNRIVSWVTDLDTGRGKMSTTNSVSIDDFDSNEPLTPFEEALLEQCIRLGMPQKDSKNQRGGDFKTLDREKEAFDCGYSNEITPLETALLEQCIRLGMPQKKSPKRAEGSNPCEEHNKVISCTTAHLNRLKINSDNEKDKKCDHFTCTCRRKHGARRKTMGCAGSKKCKDSNKSDTHKT